MMRLTFENLLWLTIIISSVTTLLLLKLDAPTWTVDLSVALGFATGLPAIFLALWRQLGGS